MPSFLSKVLIELVTFRLLLNLLDVVRLGCLVDFWLSLLCLEDSKLCAYVTIGVVLELSLLHSLMDEENLAGVTFKVLLAAFISSSEVSLACSHGNSL